MILNQQKRVRVNVRRLDDFLHRVLATLRLSSEAATICLVSNAKIAKWNGTYRKKNRATDVLSFPTGAENRRRAQGRGGNSPANQNGYLGDIAIAPAVARRNARQAGHSLEQEIQILTLHGLLHLMGYDHETDNGAMERLEKRLRQRLRIS